MDGKKLKMLREKHGYTRKLLAEKIYVTESIIQSWEEGWSIINPSSGEIEGMAEAFNISEEFLRETINAEAEDDYDENNSLSFIDYIDAGLRAIKYCKEIYDKSN